MGLTSNTGLLATVSQKPALIKQKSSVDLRCEVTPAPFMLRPYAGLYNPFSAACSVLCNHPADTDSKEYVKRAKENWFLDGKPHYLSEDLTKIQDGDKEKIRTPHDIVTEDMFRRYAETDSRPLTPAPTLASGKSRGSRRCLTPDQPHTKTAIVLDLRRSHSQETLYYHGYTTSDMTGGINTSPTNERSTLPSLNLSDGAHARLLKGQCEQLPPLASPLVLSKRIIKEPVSVRTAKKCPVCAKPSIEQHKMLPFLISKTKLLPSRKSKDKVKDNGFFVTGDNLTTVKPRRVNRKPLKLPSIIPPSPCDCNLLHLTKIVICYAPKRRKRGGSNIVLSMTAWGTTGQRKRMKMPSVKITRKFAKEKPLVYDSDEFFKKLENQLKALNLSKPMKSKTKSPPASQRSKAEKEGNEGNDDVTIDDGGGDGEGKRRGKRRKKGRNGGSDRMTSAGLAAQAQQDPETQIAGIVTDSQNPSSRGSIAPSADDDIIILPVIKPVNTRKTDSFLDDDILKYLHREVDEEAIETEFDIKRRYVLEEAFRTRPERPYGAEMQALLKELKVPAVSLGDWLHIPRVFSRQNAQFTLPIDSNALETLTPMNYAARFVTLKKSKQLLYLTVLRKFRERGYRMPIKDIEEGLILMMGGILTAEQASQFKSIMEFDIYVEEDSIPDEIKLTLLGGGKRSMDETGDAEENTENTLKYRTWCGLCAVCERVYGRFPPRHKDPPDGMELSDFTMVETKLAVLKVHKGLVEILITIRER